MRLSPPAPACWPWRTVDTVSGHDSILPPPGPPVGGCPACDFWGDANELINHQLDPTPCALPIETWPVRRPVRVIAQDGFRDVDDDAPRFWHVELECKHFARCDRESLDARQVRCRICVGAAPIE